MAQSAGGHATQLVGPDGEIISWETLPASTTTRWVTRRKVQLLAAIRGGVLTVEEACERYRLTVDELSEWQAALDKHGTRGLKTTLTQQYRFLRGVDSGRRG